MTFFRCNNPREGHRAGARFSGGQRSSGAPGTLDSIFLSLVNNYGENYDDYDDGSGEIRELSGSSETRYAAPRDISAFDYIYYEHPFEPRRRRRRLRRKGSDRRFMGCPFASHRVQSLLLLTPPPPLPRRSAIEVEAPRKNVSGEEGDKGESRVRATMRRDTRLVRIVRPQILAIFFNDPFLRSTIVGGEEREMKARSRHSAARRKAPSSD